MCVCVVVMVSSRRTKVRLLVSVIVSVDGPSSDCQQ